jgi:hypothetical protein
MDSVCKFMCDNYRWGIKEFLHTYATEVSEEQLNDSLQTCVRKLNEAIFSQEEVIEAVKDQWKSFPKAGLVSLDELRKEIDALRTSSVHYGQYEGEKSLKALDMNQAVDELKIKAPLFYQTLENLMAVHRDDYTCSEDLHRHRTVILSSILCFTYAAKTSNYIPSSLGIYLHGNGVKQQVISTMAGLGLSVSYNMILHNVEQISDAAKESFIQRDFGSGSGADTQEEEALRDWAEH